MQGWLSLLRVHQWYKNLLCLVILAIHPELLGLEVMWLFMAMCVASSTVYLVNDIIDRQADSTRKDRCHRPLASGLITIPDAVSAIPVLVALAIVLWPEGISYRWLAIYWGINLAYNLTIKKNYGYGLATGISVLACHLIRVTPLAAVDGVLDPGEWGVMAALALMIFPLTAWKQRSYLFESRLNQVALRCMGLFGIGVLTVCLYPHLGLASFIWWLFITIFYSRILHSRNTREPCRALFC